MPDPLATSYLWDLPPGSSFTGPDSTANITIDIHSISDSICVTPMFNGTPGLKRCKYLFVDLMNASINGDTLICGNEIAGINAISNGGVSPFTFQWSNGNTSQGQFVTPFLDQTFSVTITDGLGCSDKASHLVKVIPGLVIVAGDDITISPGSSTELTATGDSLFLWSPSSNLSCSQCPSPLAFPTQTTTYYVTSINPNECTKGDSVTVFVEIEDNILIPNIFTPNGDGINDIWKVNGVDIESIVIIIYNRWGQNVYHSNIFSEGWNGESEGSSVPVGVYAYYIEYTVTGENFSSIKSGDITLIR